jgi:hypothetical protein
MLIFKIAFGIMVFAGVFCYVLKNNDNNITLCFDKDEERLRDNRNTLRKRKIERTVDLVLKYSMIISIILFLSSVIYRFFIK